MASNYNLARLIISIKKRNAVKNGTNSSAYFNSTVDEILRDLTSVKTEWNNKLVPLLLTVPDGADDTSVNAFTSGLSGATLYTDSGATTTSDSGVFYESTDQRPKTIKENFLQVGLDLAAAVLSLETIISASTSALTDAQKAAIGWHIFDPTLTSSSTSIDGRSQNNASNINQLGKDLYGTTDFVLDNSGNALLDNSLKDMVHALLTLHNGHWNSPTDIDTVLSHTLDLATATGELDQLLVDDSDTESDDPALIAGTPTNLQMDLNQIRAVLRRAQGTGGYKTAPTADPIFAGGPTTLQGIIDLGGNAATKTATNPWGYLLSDIYGTHLLPDTDDTTDIGSAALRWRDIYLGPGSVHIVSTAAETTTARNWSVEISQVVGSGIGSLMIGLDGYEEILRMSPAGIINIGTYDAILEGSTPDLMYKNDRAGLTNITSKNALTDVAARAYLVAEADSAKATLGSFSSTYATTALASASELLTTATNGLHITASDISGFIAFHTGAGTSDATERMRIDENGNVGIGILVPSGMLHVTGQSYFDDNCSFGGAFSNLNELFVGGEATFYDFVYMEAPLNIYTQYLDFGTTGVVNSGHRLLSDLTSAKIYDLNGSVVILDVTQTSADLCPDGSGGYVVDVDRNTAVITTASSITLDAPTLNIANSTTIDGTGLRFDDSIMVDSGIGIRSDASTNYTRKELVIGATTANDTPTAIWTTAMPAGAAWWELDGTAYMGVGNELAYFKKVCATHLVGANLTLASSGVHEIFVDRSGTLAAADMNFVPTSNIMQLQVTGVAATTVAWSVTLRCQANSFVLPF